MADISLRTASAGIARRRIDMRLLFAAFIIFLFSYLMLSQFSTGGDQKYYNKLWVALKDKGFVRGYVTYQLTLGAMEPVYYTIIWVFTRVLDKALFMSLVNALLAVVLILNVRRITRDLLPVWIIATNFYLYVLMFSAERLKFGILFFGIMLLVHGRKRHLLALLSLFSHFQLVFLLIVVYIMPSARQVLHLRSSKNFWKLVLISIIGLAVGRIFLEYFLNKFAYYSRDFDILSLGKLCVIMALTVYVSRNRMDGFSNQIVLFIPALFVGTDRMLMFLYMVYLWRLFENRKVLSLSSLLINGYFFVTGLLFLYRTILYNYGFAIR